MKQKMIQSQVKIEKIITNLYNKKSTSNLSNYLLRITCSLVKI